MFSLTGFLLAGFLLAGCGKRRPPQPPIERIPQRTELLSGVQRGNLVILSWPAPQRNAPATSVQSIERIDVYRLAEKNTAPLPLTEEEFGSKSTLIGSVTSDQIRSAKETLTYADPLELAGQPTRLRYALRYVNGAGQRGAFSNFLLIQPASTIALPPIVNKPAKETESSITITWQAPSGNVDGSTPANILGYNIYRTAESEKDSGQAPLNSKPIPATQYEDKTFRFGELYTYRVRTVSLGSEGAQVESLDSNPVAVAPIDIYPPSKPGPITIAAAPGKLSLFFPANPEPDVAGYNIYRSTDSDPASRKWTKLNDKLLTRTTYTDQNVEKGKTYYYEIDAVDQAGNPSVRSDVASETVP
jgi:hypothetical protein